MPTIQPDPLFLGDCLLSFGGDEWAYAVSQVSFTPTSSVQRFKGLNPNAGYSAGTAAVWQLDLTYVQDWKSVKSLSRYLFANEGAEVVAVFTPRVGGTAVTVTATIIITAGAIGGQVDGYATASVSLGVKGKPAITPGA